MPVRTNTIKSLPFLLLFTFFIGAVCCQEFPPASSSAILHNIKKLKNTASVLYVGTRPKDINAQLLLYLSNERLLRCGYLSLTRGESSSNNLSDETGIDLGLLRTQEMMMTAREAGIQLFFTRAYDFGAIKNITDAFKIWTKNKLLDDVVNIIRQFQPDIIITRYDTLATSGENAATAQLVTEAFTLAADSAYRTEENMYASWGAKRLLHNVADNATDAAGSLLALPVQHYNSLLGNSYYEQAVNSRRFQKTEGLEYIYAKEKAAEYFTVLAGDQFSNDILEGVDTSWNKFKESNAINASLDSIIATYQYNQPELSVNKLGRLYELIKSTTAGLHHKWYALAAVQQLMFDCAGIVVSATTNQEFAVQGDSCLVHFKVENRKQNDLIITGIKLNSFDTVLNNKEADFTCYLQTSMAENISQPYWLASPMGDDYIYRVSDLLQVGRPENTPRYIAQFSFALNGSKWIMMAPVQYQYADKIKGMRSEVLSVIEPIIVSMKPNVLLTNVSTIKGKKIVGDSLLKIQFKTNFSGDSIAVAIKIAQPSYRIVRNDSTVSTKEKTELYNEDTIMNMHAGEVYNFAVPLPYLKLDKNKINNGVIGVTIAIKKDDVTRNYSSNLRMIDYGYIPPVSYHYRDLTAVIGDNIKTAETMDIGYVNPYIDNVCDGLSKLGFSIKLLSGRKAFDSLANYKVVFVKSDVNITDSAIARALFDYVNNGGNLIMQLPQSDSVVTPFMNAPLALARLNAGNSTVQADVKDNPLFNYPNLLKSDDFLTWRKDYSTSQLAIADERWNLLFAFYNTSRQMAVPVLTSMNIGKGKVVYSGITWGYQLSSGVASAYKLMANLLAYLR